MRKVWWLLLGPLALAMLGHAEPAVNGDVTWVVIQDDDGERESHWGAATDPRHRICKIIDLGIAPAQVRVARISYVVGFAPYHNKTQQHFDAVQEGISWANVTVRLNDTVVACRPAIELMRPGAHRLPVERELLRQGQNRIVFAWQPRGPDTPADASYGYFYLGIDTDRQTRRSCSSADDGKTWSYDVLRAGAGPDPRWRGEYLVRLEIALPNGTHGKDHAE